MKETNSRPYVILVVDDEMEIRSLITDFLSDDEGYEVLEAKDAREALDKILPSNKVDLVMSDINMPGMKGFEFLNEVRRLYPLVKRILITAYNVEDYIELAQKYDIGNIFAKTTPFNFDELSSVLKNLLSGNIFGIQRYFDKTVVEKKFVIRRIDAIDRQIADVLSCLPVPISERKLNLVMTEIISNAVFYGIRGENPAKKETWDYNFELSDSQAIQISVAFDNSKYAISIADKGGRLNKNDVLYWLHRQVTNDESGKPVGLVDSHGRGLFIVRRYIDRLIINIEPKRTTEIIIINYTGENFKGSKPLYINEL